MSDSPGIRPTILVVDDMAPVRQVVARTLREDGYRVFEAGSGSEALQLVREFPVDLVVTDVRMQAMSGTELARIVRAERPAIPILLISGYAPPEGAPPEIPFLSKPFHADLLLATVRKLVATTAP